MNERCLPAREPDEPAAGGDPGAATGAGDDERRCRCCGTTEGLYPTDDICVECDVAYYS